MIIQTGEATEPSQIEIGAQKASKTWYIYWCNKFVEGQWKVHLKEGEHKSKHTFMSGIVLRKVIWVRTVSMSLHGTRNRFDAAGMVHWGLNPIKSKTHAVKTPGNSL